MTLPPDWNVQDALHEIARNLPVLQNHLATIQDQITALEQAGITEATPYWRKDEHGQPRILYLIHRSDNGKRKREYIGTKPAKQAQALARIERWEQHQKLIQRASRLTNRLNQIYHDIHTTQITTANQLAYQQEQSQ